MGFIYSQLFVTPEYPNQSFSGQTVIVTGSNVGLGKEAARHIARLDAKKVILAVRNTQAGEDAKKDIEASTKRAGVCEVWKLDLGDYSSVKAFAARAKNELDRLDCLLENAGIAAAKYSRFEDNESTITVNVISTFLLALLLLPKLQETATKHDTKPRLTIVSSEVHAWSKFKERNEPQILATLNDEKTADMSDRYMVSKLLEVLAIRQISPMIATSKNKDVTLNTLNPGLCHSELGRDAGFTLTLLKFFLARTTEVGSRTLVAGASGGVSTHGQYMHDGKVNDDEVVAWVKTDEGKKIGAQVWREISEKLEKIEPGVTKVLQ